jgi:hypothetical protein
VYSRIEDPISGGMLLAEVTFFLDESAEFFGFWYSKETTPPNQVRKKDVSGGSCRDAE